jgi:hypothetical protein
MCKMNRTMGPTTRTNLERVVEPLASFICATEQPRAALASALAILFNEVEQTNRAANAHFATISENQWS